MPTGNEKFGRRVIGDAEYDKAVREQAGGGNVFGSRVRDAIPEDGPSNIAKRNTEHGVRVVDQVQPADEKGKTGDEGCPSVDSLRNILSENPTFFDSLFELELARPSGAREDALRIFQQVEQGIKGAGREDVLRDIANLLGQSSQVAAARADLAQAQRAQTRRMIQRQEENTALMDTDRLQALADRAEAVKSIEESGTDAMKSQIISSDVDNQVRQIADEKGLEIPTGRSGEPKGHTPAKPDGPVHVETQQPGPRLLTPKGDSKDETSSAGSRAQGSDSGSSSDEGEGEGGEEEQDYEALTKAELEEEADRLGVDRDGIKGSGAEGAVLKADLVKAVKKAAKQKSR